MVAQEIKNSLLHFVFPSYCLHCQEDPVESDLLFCSFCQTLIELFPIDQSAPYQSVAVEKQGAILSLLRERNGSMQEEIVKTMAALMAVQMKRLHWPLPDKIFPSPKDPINRYVSKVLSSWLDVPSYDWIQSENLWTPGNCSDQILLVVDLVLSFSTSWDLLQEGAPSQVFMMGLVMA